MIKNILILILIVLSATLSAQTRPDQQPSVTDPNDDDAFYSQERGTLFKYRLDTLRGYYLPDIITTTAAYTPGVGLIPVEDRYKVIKGADGNYYYIDKDRDFVQFGGSGSSTYLDLDFTGTTGLSDGVDDEGITGVTDDETIDFSVSGSNISGRVLSVRSHLSSQSLNQDIAQNFTLESLQGTLGFLSDYHGFQSRGEAANDQAQLLFDDNNYNMAYRSKHTGSWVTSFVYHQLFPPDKLRYNSFLVSNWLGNPGQDFAVISSGTGDPGTGNYSGMYYPDNATANHTGWYLAGRAGVTTPSLWVRNVNSGTFGNWFEVYHEGNPPPAGAGDNLGDHEMIQDLITGNNLIRNATATGSELRMQSASINLQPTGSASFQYIFNDTYVTSPNASTAPVVGVSNSHVEYVLESNEYGRTKTRKYLRKTSDFDIGGSGTTQNDRYVMESDYYRRNKVIDATINDITTTADPAEGIDDLAFSGIPAGRYRYTATIYHSKDSGTSTARSDFEFAITGSFDATNLHWYVVGDGSALVETKHSTDDFTGAAYPSTNIYKTKLILDIQFTTTGSITPEIEGEITSGGNDFINVHENSSSTLERLD